MKASSFVVTILISGILVSACSSGTKLIVESESIGRKEAKQRLKFWVPTSQHLIQINAVPTSSDQGDVAITNDDVIPYFQPAQRMQSFRPDHLLTGETKFNTPKGQVIPDQLLPESWTSETFGKTQAVRMIGSEGDTLFSSEVYLPSIMQASLLDHHPDSLYFSWNADSTNPYGVYIQCVVIRGPHLGYPGALKNFMVNYLVDDSEGSFTLSHSMFPEWVWEDEAHTSLEVAVFRRNTAVEKMKKGKGTTRVVCTQGRQFKILPAGATNASH